MDIENDLHSGFALVLAWPETKCKQAGAWYDYPLQLMNLNKNGYYKIGHAAIVLIDDHTKNAIISILVDTMPLMVLEELGVKKRIMIWDYKPLLNTMRIIIY